MSDFNIGSEWRTKIKIGTIKANEYVKITQNGDWETYGTVKTEDGREEVYQKTELTGFGYLKFSTGTFDILEDHYKDADKYGNKGVLIGLQHLTKNVRSGPSTFKFWEDCLYSSHPDIKYEYRELSDSEVIDILLNEILYDRQPDLQSTSCVGTSAKGIDKDPNYHDGTYVLCNNKEYTITYCRDTVKIREGLDSGWYQGTKDVGRTIYEDKVDWEKIKTAKIVKGAIFMLNKGHDLFNNFPEIKEILFNHLKDKDKYKLSNEFEIISKKQ